MSAPRSTMLDNVQTMDDPAPVEPELAPPREFPQYHASPAVPSQYVPATQSAAATKVAVATESWSAATLIAIVTAPGFLKAMALAFVVVFVACSFPIEESIFKQIPYLTKIPNAVAFVKALVSAIVITVLRPPAI